ncbi:ABC transporter permease [Streptomyces tsukubensis]|uniref:ABC transporter permease n=1 Tax=Streptomyces tsukubensis TaxID=83656 RepID=UPI00344D2174
MSRAAALSSGAGRGGLGAVVSDCLVLSRRSLRHLTRSPDEIVQAVVLPVMLLLLFRFLFGGAVDTGGPGYANYLIAGVIVLSVAFSASSTAVGVADDLRNGLVERFRTMPMFGAAVLVGHVVSAVLRNVLAVVLVTGVGLLVGFRPEATATEWLTAVGILLVFMFAVAWLGALIGTVSAGVEAAGGYAMILVFLPYASSALVPSETMPGALRMFVDHQPFTPVVNAVRALLIDLPAGDAVPAAFAWWVPILVLAAAFTVHRFARRTGG